jgi:hypothetical protein
MAGMIDSLKWLDRFVGGEGELGEDITQGVPQRVDGVHRGSQGLATDGRRLCSKLT